MLKNKVAWFFVGHGVYCGWLRNWPIGNSLHTLTKLRFVEAG